MAPRFDFSGGSTSSFVQARAKSGVRWWANRPRRTARRAAKESGAGRENAWSLKKRGSARPSLD